MCDLEKQQKWSKLLTVRTTWGCLFWPKTNIWTMALDRASIQQERHLKYSARIRRTGNSRCSHVDVFSNPLPVSFRSLNLFLWEDHFSFYFGCFFFLLELFSFSSDLWEAKGAICCKRLCRIRRKCLQFFEALKYCKPAVSTAEITGQAWGDSPQGPLQTGSLQPL